MNKLKRFKSEAVSGKLDGFSLLRVDANYNNIYHFCLSKFDIGFLAADQGLISYKKWNCNKLSLSIFKKKEFHN